LSASPGAGFGKHEFACISTVAVHIDSKIWFKYELSV